MAARTARPGAATGRRPSEDAIAGAAIVAGVVVAAALPALGPLLAWPFLLAVPGTLLAARAVPVLSAPGRLGVGVVVTVALASHLGYLEGRLIGVSHLSVALLAGALAAASWVLATRALPGLAPAPWRDGAALPRRAAVAALWRGHRAGWLCGAAAGVSVGIVLLGTAFHHIQGGWAAGAANWSDLLLHVSIATTIQHGNLPPQVPFFAGTPLVYHWFSDLHGALLASGSSVSVVTAMSAGSACMAGALGLGAYELGRTVVGGVRAGVLTSVVTVFGAGVSWIRLPVDILNGGAVGQLLRAHQYDFEQAPGTLTHVPPVFEVGLIVQRPMAYGLPMLVVAVLLIDRALHGSGRSAGFLLAGTVVALAVPFQLFTLPVLALLIPALLVARRAWRRPDAATNLALLLAPLPYGLAYALPSLRSGGPGHLRFVAGWQDGPVGQGATRWILFHLLGLGIPALLAAVALVGRRTPARPLLLAWAVLPVVLVDTVQVTAIAFDSSKLFQLGWPGIALAAAWTAHRWRTALLVPVMAVATLGAAAGAAWAFADTRLVLTDGQEAAARWIDTHTPDHAVFVTPSFINMPTDLAGRLRITGFASYTANYGGNQAARDRDVAAVYCAGDEAAADAMRRNGTDWVLVEGADCGGGPGTDFLHSPLFDVPYNRDGVAVAQLRG